MGAAQGWVNDVLTPRTLKGYIDDALHRLKMAILTVFSHFKHQEAKIQPHIHKYVEYTHPNDIWAAQGWVNDALPPLTLKAYLHDALHHLKMATFLIAKLSQSKSSTQLCLVIKNHLPAWLVTQTFNEMLGNKQTLLVRLSLNLNCLLNCFVDLFFASSTIDMC